MFAQYVSGQMKVYASPFITPFVLVRPLAQAISEIKWASTRVALAKGGGRRGCWRGYAPGLSSFCGPVNSFSKLTKNACAHFACEKFWDSLVVPARGRAMKGRGGLACSTIHQKCSLYKGRREVAQGRGTSRALHFHCAAKMLKKFFVTFCCFLCAKWQRPVA